MKCIFLLILLGFGVPAWTQERALNVTGSCVKLVLPNRASVEITTEVLRKTVNEASQSASVSYNKLREVLKGLKLKDFEMETTQYSLFEHREWERNKSVFKGFKTIIGLRVTSSEISRMGEALHAASQFESTQVSGLKNFVSDELYKETRESCLEEAVLNAKKKAERIAKAAGVSLGKMISFTEEQNSSFQPMMRSQMAFAKDAMVASESMQVEVANSKVEVQINVGFSL